MRTCDVNRLGGLLCTRKTPVCDVMRIARQQGVTFLAVQFSLEAIHISERGIQDKAAARTVFVPQPPASSTRTQSQGASRLRGQGPRHLVSLVCGTVNALTAAPSVWLSHDPLYGDDKRNTYTIRRQAHQELH